MQPPDFAPESLSTGELTVRQVDWAEAQNALRSIREQVFILEQGVPPEIEIDGRDKDAYHFLGTLDGVPVACGRLQRDGKVSRMAVLPVHRGRDFGRQVLEAIIQAAGGLGMDHLYLHAQAHAGGFYRKAGFVGSGDIFDEADIPHIAMSLDLPGAKSEDERRTGVGYPSPFDTLAVRLCGRARRELRILSPDLDFRVFDRPELVDAVAAFVRGGHQARLRILIADSRSLVDRGHRLLELARRIPSKVVIQRLAEHPQWNGETAVICDREAVLVRSGDDDNGAIYEPDSRPAAQRYSELFEELWKRSEPDPELRSLRL